MLEATPPMGVRPGTPPPHPPGRLPGHGPTRAGLVLVNPRFLVAGLTWACLWLCAAAVGDVAWLKSQHMQARDGMGHTGRIQSQQHPAEIALNVPQVGLNSIPAVRGHLLGEI